METKARGKQEGNYYRMCWCILECFGTDEADHTDMCKALQSNHMFRNLEDAFDPRVDRQMVARPIPVVCELQRVFPVSRSMQNILFALALAKTLFVVTARATSDIPPSCSSFFQSSVPVSEWIPNTLPPSATIRIFSVSICSPTLKGFETLCQLTNL